MESFAREYERIYAESEAKLRQEDELADRLRVFTAQCRRWQEASRRLPLGDFLWQLLEDTGYYEYVGTDYEKDMARMAADPTTQEWWKLTDPCQIPLESRREGEWWAEMEEVFHLD